MQVVLVSVDVRKSDKLSGEHSFSLRGAVTASDNRAEQRIT